MSNGFRQSRLSLSVETLKALTNEEAQHVAGARQAYSDWDGCPTGGEACVSLYRAC